MADERLRELQREWEHTGDPEDGLRYAREAYRQEVLLEELPAAVGGLVLGMWRDDGRLTDGQLRLAALAGLEAARALQPDEEWPDAGEPEWTHEALAGAGELPGAFYRAWFGGLAERIANLIDLPLPDADVLPALVEAVEAQVDSPSDAAAARIRTRLDPLAGWDEDGLLQDLAWERADDEEAAERAVGAVHAFMGVCQALVWSQENGGSTAIQDPAWNDDSPLPERAVVEAARVAAVEVALRPREAGGRTAAVPYSPKARFRVGERLVHPKFGEGEVVRAAARQVHVQFADGVRKLAQGLGG